MTEYRITFGVKYKDIPHPAGDWVTPHGWLTIIAPDEDTARTLANAVLGQGQWAGIYPATGPGGLTVYRYPLGEIARITFAIKERT